MPLPLIHTALPKRRYQYGEFTMVVLGEIDSRDNVPYQFLMAVIPPEANTPELFVSVEKCSRQTSQDGKYQMRVIADQMSQTLGKSDSWGDLDAFINDALAVLSKLLNLTDEQPMVIL